MNLKNIPVLFSLILAVLLFVIVMVFIGLFFSLPARAEAEFGVGNAKLSYPDRLSYSIRLYMVEDDLVKPVNESQKEIVFKVVQGESIDDISSQLEKAGLIRNADAFRLYLIYTGLDRSIQAGEFKISDGMNAMEIAKSMQDYKPDEVTFNILAGWRLEEIAAALPTSGINISPDAFLNAAQKVNNVSLPPEYADFKSFEGLLLPGSYTIKRNADVYEFLTILMSGFDQRVNNEIRVGFKHQGLSLHQGVILASIVEREAVLDEEKPQIASVFLNRIKAGIKLESDPTVQYALGYDNSLKSWWKNPLTQADLEVDSPYNTYLSPGLPPGPISNPGIKALRAIAFPADTPFYFFRAKCDQSGQHDFSKTYQEHAAKTCP
jgi:UPF0755 protein